MAKTAPRLTDGFTTGNLCTFRLGMNNIAESSVVSEAGEWNDAFAIERLRIEHSDHNVAWGVVKRNWQMVFS